MTFSGIKRGDEYICFSIVANNVQITTLQNLVYVRMELGKLGIANSNPNTELAESRVSKAPNTKLIVFVPISQTNADITMFASV